MPVPTIPAKSPVNTNSVEPIPAGAGITAASITDNAVIAMVSTRLIFLSPAKRRYGIPYQKQSFNKFNPITPATIFFLCKRYLEAVSRSAHCSLNWCSNASYFPFLLKKSSIAKISWWNFVEQQNRISASVITMVIAYPARSSQV